MRLNDEFTANIKDIYGQAGLTWLRNLPQILAQLSDSWHFDFLNPMPHLTYNFVGLVRMKFPERLAIIKLLPDSQQITREINWLNSLKKGVPQVYLADEERSVFIMEYLQPGTSLKHRAMTNDDEATRILCRSIIELQTAQQAKGEFQHLSELPQVLPILKGHMDSRLLSQAQTWFDELTQNRDHDVVLHGDLHHDNLLSSGESWKAIDPHGYLGDPAAEVGVMIRNPVDCFPRDRPLDEIIERRLKIMTEELPFDPQRIKAWAFCMTVLSAAWTLEGHGRVAGLELQVAAAVDRVRV